jgi:hypothetical protein
MTTNQEQRCIEAIEARSLLPELLPPMVSTGIYVQVALIRLAVVYEEYPIRIPHTVHTLVSNFGVEDQTLLMMNDTAYTHWKWSQAYSQSHSAAGV